MYEFNEGDILTLKKHHACGSYDWKLLVRGVVVTIECVECNRVVKLKRTDLNKRIKKITKGEVGNEK
ncbi:MAG: DUF951 family protein [Bacilli bacterium]